MTTPTALVPDQTGAEIFAQVLTSGPVSRTVIAQRLGLSPSTVTRLLTPLIEGGYLSETGQQSATGLGRPQRLLRVNTEQHLVVGIQIARTHVAAVLTDLGARPLLRMERSLTSLEPAHVLSVAADLTARLIAEARTGDAKVLGIGVGVGGHVDAAAGVCRSAVRLGWTDVAVAAPLSEATGLPVVVNNDVNALVIAERWFGEGREVDSFAVISVGRGIGGGLMLHGVLHSGAGGLAVEFGHLPIEPNGPDCACGNRGCVEALASSDAVLRLFQEAGGRPDADYDAVAEFARSGTEIDRRAALHAFSVAGDALGRGLACLCNLLNPGLIVIAGEGVVAYEHFGPAMTAALERHAVSTAARDCVIKVDEASETLWARGAACLVIRESVRARLS
ncbi:ROK family transcriptional regulator [Streptomyces sp. TLI_105]|uniref:ROK family transcriptional regulator n=1 Tax=Streptomyces sp. TLI_105 TaxID=1881019 RepID=UPI0008963D0B|nr:ROK family transcriptional regulator [Streptomyces sp. TLI_105]SEE09947.1 Sugar kinase of the NBD/HSP70 family, may contain an N-terminal HTH domain [Streptomyces sp. TLI_105]